ncbi:hypothetical protein L228DRAFT_268352 [Xylona heveae TC161]|uniref:DUF4336 domain-containing protein n=1 Tax=Xylona heveae (strain CBS 132557 / TC161) TaxID=1328760 RepID=A0A165H4W0_XYLHT|nr:hypothetical protein L228DRAFT_268352 [Xylona heveae TC161]KZF22986.1 hypothetical protein L228DRAFT_268352 [Xylona heveae TC161]
MTSKLIPKNPSEVMVIRKVTPNITTLSVPFERYGRIKVGGRGTIVRLQSGALAVFSPVALTPEVRTTVEELGGNVRYITALDFEHHIFLGDWHKAFPEAKVIGPEGLPEKRKQQKYEEVPFSTVFTRAAHDNNEDIRIDPDFDSDFEYEYVPSHANRELAFLYKPDRTLIEADLLFNLPATEQYSRTGKKATSGFLTKFFAKAMRTKGKARVQRRLLWYLVTRQDRIGFGKSMARIDKWNFDRIIPCHGDVIEIGGKAIFRNVMEWHLRELKAAFWHKKYEQPKAKETKEVAKEEKKAQ